MTTTLILIRHGKTIHNTLGHMAGWTDSDLTEEGLIQAELVARHVNQLFRLDAIYSSPLQRARKTAEIVGRQIGIQPILVEDLKELHFGDLEGLNDAEFQARYPELWTASRNREDLDFAWPGGESRREFHERVSRAFERIIAGHPDQTVAVVAHGGVLGSYIADISVGQPELWREFLVDNCSVCEVQIDGNRITLSCFNETSHLDERVSPGPTKS